MIGYRPLPGDERLLAPLTDEERRQLCLSFLRTRAGRKGGKANRIKTKLARHHTAFMKSIFRGKNGQV